MQDTEVHEMMLSIIKHAQTAKPSEFHLLRSWSEYRFNKGKRRTFKLALGALERIANRLFKKYCNSVASGKDDLNKLLAYQQMLSVICFYRQELITVTNMIYEYESYLMTGNFFKALFGATRSDTDRSGLDIQNLGGNTWSIL